jgi:hypothetical protein
MSLGDRIPVLSTRSILAPLGVWDSTFQDVSQFAAIYMTGTVYDVDSSLEILYSNDGGFSPSQAGSITYLAIGENFTKLIPVVAKYVRVVIVNLSTILSSSQTVVDAYGTKSAALSDVKVINTEPIPVTFLATSPSIDISSEYTPIVEYDFDWFIPGVIMQTLGADPPDLTNGALGGPRYRDLIVDSDNANSRMLIGRNDQNTLPGSAPVLGGALLSASSAWSAWAGADAGRKKTTDLFLVQASPTQHLPVEQAFRSRFSGAFYQGKRNPGVGTGFARSTCYQFLGLGDYSRRECLAFPNMEMKSLGFGYVSKAWEDVANAEFGIRVFDRLGQYTVVIPQYEWNGDKADGTGKLPPMFWNRVNSFQIVSEGGGSGPQVYFFYVMDRDSGEYVLVHTHSVYSVNTFQDLNYPLADIQAFPTSNTWGLLQYLVLPPYLDDGTGNPVYSSMGIGTKMEVPGVYCRDFALGTLGKSFLPTYPQAANYHNVITGSFGKSAFFEFRYANYANGYEGYKNLRPTAPMQLLEMTVATNSYPWTQFRIVKNSVNPPPLSTYYAPESSRFLMPLEVSDSEGYTTPVLEPDINPRSRNYEEFRFSTPPSGVGKETIDLRSTNIYLYPGDRLMIGTEGTSGQVRAVNLNFIFSYY